MPIAPMKYIPLTMVREHMDNIPVFEHPPGYHFHTYQDGDERDWATIETAAGEFSTVQEAHARFLEDYGNALSELHDRCFFIVKDDGTKVGTASAWYGTFNGQVRGRVGWVGIIPSEQGKKLAKPLLSAVMVRLAADHPSAYLTTQTTSWRAVNIYLDFGFVPYSVDDTAREGWLLMEQVLQRRIL